MSPSINKRKVVDFDFLASCIEDGRGDVADYLIQKGRFELTRHNEVEVEVYTAIFSGNTKMLELFLRNRVWTPSDYRLIWCLLETAFYGGNADAIDLLEKRCPDWLCKIGGWWDIFDSIMFDDDHECNEDMVREVLSKILAKIPVVNADTYSFDEQGQFDGEAANAKYDPIYAVIACCGRDMQLAQRLIGHLVAQGVAVTHVHLAMIANGPSDNINALARMLFEFNRLAVLVPK